MTSRRHATLVFISLLGLAFLDPERAHGADCLLETQTEAGIRAIALHDFDEDGAMDVVAVTAQQVVLHRGHGDATFSPPVTVDTGNDLRDVIVGDFDEDGVADLVVVDRMPLGVRVLLGRSDGSFDPPVLYAVGTTPVSIASGDFDENGIEDLVVLDETDGRGRILRGLGAGGVGDGSFQLYTFVSLSRVGSVGPHLQVLDVDQDGMLDITANVQNVGSFHQVAIAYGTGTAGVGSGFFQGTAYFNTAVSPSDFLIADVDRDGLNDIVVSYTALKYVEFHSGLGNRNFGPYHLEVVDVFPGRLAAFDLEGDGPLEVLFSATERTGILPIRAGSSWPERMGQERARICVGPGPFVAAPLNNDSVIDVVTFAPGASSFFVQTGECVPEARTLDVRPEGLWGSGGRALVTGAGGREGVSAARDGEGGAFLTWRDRRDLADGELYITRIGPDGFAVPPWPPQGRAVRPPAGGSPDGGPIPDGSGGVYVIVGEGAGANRRIVAEHLAADGSPAVDWPVGGFPITTPEFAPLSIVSDGLGGLIAVGRYIPPAGGLEIRARRWTSSAAVAAGWPVEGAVVAAWGTGTTFTSAVSDEMGGVYISWDTYIPPCTGHGCGFGYWADDLAYVTGGSKVWGTTIGPNASSSPWFLPDDRGGALGSYSPNGFDAILGVWRPSGVQWASPSPFAMYSLYGMTGDGDNGAVLVGLRYNEGYFIDRLNRSGARPPGPWPATGTFLFSDEGFVGIRGDLFGGALVLSRTSAGPEGTSLKARYVSNIGTPAPGWSSAGHVLRTSSGIPSRLPILLDDHGGILLFWDDPNHGSPAIYGQRLGSDIPVPVAVSLVDVEADHGFVRLRWMLGARAEGDPVVERREAGDTDWSPIGSALIDQAGTFHVFEDRAVEPGQRLEYRLAVRDEGSVRYSEVATVEVAAARLVLSLTPQRQPMRRGDVVRFTLPAPGSATLEAFDVRGRRVWSQSLDGLEPGPHETVVPVALPGGSIHWIRLTQGTESTRARIILLD